MEGNLNLLNVKSNIYCFAFEQGRTRLRGRMRSTSTTTTTTTTPVPIYEEEYDDYEQYEDYSYSEGDADEVEGGWERARELLEEEVFFCAFLSSLEKSAFEEGDLKLS